jgi:hypothetical protein
MNKEAVMKYKVLVLTLAWLLAACAPGVTSEPTQTLALTPEPTQTATLTPEQIPTTVPYAAPEYLPTGVGEVPASIQSEWRDQVASLNTALLSKGIDSATVNYLFVSWSQSFPNSASGQLEYRLGTIIQLKSNPNVIYWARYTDGAKEFTPRPDMRPVSREWKFEQVTVPAGFGPTVQLRAYFPDGQDVPHVYLVDTSIVNAQGQPKVIAEFNRDTGIFYTLGGEILTPPTPAVDYSRFFLIPNTPKEFKTSSGREDAFALMDYLDVHPELSHLTPGSEAPLISSQLTNPSGEGHFVINCNANGTVNCAPEAFMQFNEQGIDVHVIIWGIRNGDGTTGYFAQYIYDSFQFGYINDYNRLIADPFGYHDIMIHVGLTDDAQKRYPYTVFLFQQPGYNAAIQWLIDNKIVPEAFRNLILSW